MPSCSLCSRTTLKSCASCCLNARTYLLCILEIATRTLCYTTVMTLESAKLCWNKIPRCSKRCLQLETLKGTLRVTRLWREAILRYLNSLSQIPCSPQTFPSKTKTNLYKNVTLHRFATQNAKSAGPGSSRIFLNVSWHLSRVWVSQARCALK